MRRKVGWAGALLAALLCGAQKQDGPVRVVLQTELAEIEVELGPAKANLSAHPEVVEAWLNANAVWKGSHRGAIVALNRASQCGKRGRPGSADSGKAPPALRSAAVGLAAGPGEDAHPVSRRWAS